MVNLTNRERCALVGVTEGKTSTQIGAALQISSKSVERALLAARSKMGIVGRSGVGLLVARAFEAGVVQPGETLLPNGIIGTSARVLARRG